MIKDSGERRVFETGAVRDIQEGVKGRCDLLPLEEVAELFKADYEEISPLESLARYQKTKNVAFISNAVLAFCKLKNWDLPTAMLELSMHMADGAKKYGEWNWTKGIPTHSYLDSATRHLLKCIRCDSDERHDRAFIWNCMCLVWTVKNKPGLDDISEYHTVTGAGSGGLGAKGKIMYYSDNGDTICGVDG